MKKTIFLAIVLLLALGLSAKNPTVKELQAIINVQAKTIESLEDTLMAIPDTLCVTALDSTFCVPTKDAQEVVIPIVDYIKETSENGWPKTGKGWMAWILALIPLIFGIKKITAINELWAVVKPILKTRLGLAALIGLVFSLAVTLILNGGSFNAPMFSGLAMLGTLIASFWHNVEKKKDAVQAG